ncbi:MAG: TetR/AcrR family transcriptional regulator [Thiolinea sp.]
MSAQISVKNKRSAPGAEQNIRLTREDWINAALAIFTEKGIDAVRIEPLAQRLRVTKGSFYWHFKNREALHQAIIDHWQQLCVQALTDCFSEDDDIIDVVLNILLMWMRDEPFSPQLDAAMRDWARRSEYVRSVVKQADQTRTDAIAGAFERAGYEPESALIRARTLYFLQIGYYEADLQEARPLRVRLWGEYIRVITGLEPGEERLAAFRERNFEPGELAGN